MFRLYLGNLAGDVTEAILHELFTSEGLNPSNIQVKRGYAFVDCPDQDTFDKAIESLNGHNLMGSVMQVEPSTMSKKRRSTRVTIQNVPAHVTKEDIEHLTASFGNVQICELVTNTMETSVNVTYENPDQAQQAVEQLNNYDYQGSVLKVDLAYNGNGSGDRGSGRGSGGYRGGAPGTRGGPGGGNRNSGNSRGTGYPLRILVPSDFVGAIIGRKGQTIRNITTQCKARVDVHGKENSGLLEKFADSHQSLPQVISIYGQPDNCSNACKEILKVMQQEAQTQSQQRGPDQGGEISLKMLADDRYCGRIIGKEGKVIKKIREDTDTKITVSKDYVFAHSVQEMPALYPDRVITIRGSLDNMAQAETAISAKLRECYDKEMQAPQGPPGMMMGPPGALGGMGMMGPGSGMGYGGMGGGRTPYGGPGVMGQGPGYGGYPSGTGQLSGAGAAPPVTDTCQISVPNSSVGAIIGAGGSNIKQIIRDSNAFVTIEPKKDDDPNPAAERIVTVKGTPDSIWRACFFVFEKLKQEGFAGNDDVRLRTAMKVPRSMVGRVIGRGGKNVRDIQRLTGAMVKLPEDQSNQGEEVVVEVFGNFMATQNAQSRIRALVSQGLQLPPNGAGPGGAPHMGGGSGRPSRGPRPVPSQPGGQ